MNTFLRCSVVGLSALLLASGCSKKQPEGGEYPIRPVPFTSVKLTDNFWAPRIKKNAAVTIPIAFHYCETSGRIKNFDIAAGVDTGRFQTIYPFDDSDVFKIIEGASYSLQTKPDPKLEAYLDALIYKIGNAQEEDGYLYTNRTIAEKHGGAGLHEWANPVRWLNDSISSHELYNLGHLYEAAAAHFQATGKRSLLDIALKSADLVNRDFGWDRTKVYPGHQVIEMGLVKLYRVTGERKYLDLARFFLDIRGNGQEYNQADVAPVRQTRAVGHAVRATYMYSGMADIAAIEADTAYLNAITRIWEDIVNGKIYVTGGIGATGGNEGFAAPYQLPNMSAYCETCASIGDIFFNHRLFLLHGDARYIDILEKTLYNSMLSGVSLSADRFFYPNPLESAGQHQRSAWFGCACCPSNVARFVPAIPGYIYAVTDEAVYVNLYISDEASFMLGGSRLSLSQSADFPWNGHVVLSVNPEKTQKFSVRLRIPGWARNEAIPGNLYSFSGTNDEKVRISVNGNETDYQLKDGYAVLNRKWKAGDRIVLDIPMPVRKVVADARIEDDAEKVAIQRGPLMFCAEWPDNEAGNILNLVMKEGAELSSEYRPDLLQGTQVVRTSGYQTKRRLDGLTDTLREQPILLIPYALWNNRGPGQMEVWLPVRTSAAHPLPAPTIAFQSTVKASRMTKTLKAVNDQLEPSRSDDQSVPFYDWWPANDTWEWVQYDFDKARRISRSRVYWFDDGPNGGCRIPDDWEILYLNGNMWEPVDTRSQYPVSKDEWNSISFKPVVTQSVKIKVKLKKDFSAGLYEWIIE